MLYDFDGHKREYNLGMNVADFYNANEQTLLMCFANETSNPDYGYEIIYDKDTTDVVVDMIKEFHDKAIEEDYGF